MSEMPEYLRRYAESRLAAIDAHEAAVLADQADADRKAWAVLRSAILRSLTEELGLDLAGKIAADHVPLDPPESFVAGENRYWLRIGTEEIDPDLLMSIQALFSYGPTGWERLPIPSVAVFDPERLGGPYVWRADTGHAVYMTRDLMTALALLLRRIR